MSDETTERLRAMFDGLREDVARLTRERDEMAEGVVRLRAENDRLARWLDRSITAEDAGRYVITRLLREAEGAANCFEADATITDERGATRTARLSVQWADGESAHALLAEARRERDEARAALCEYAPRCSDEGCDAVATHARVMRRSRVTSGGLRYQCDAHVEEGAKPLVGAGALRACGTKGDPT